MTATDPTHDALLAACAAFPAEDTPRLMLADHLEEQGQGERAEFIRVQVELARRQSAIRPEGCEPFCPACNAARVGQWERTPHPERAPRNSCRQCSALRRRERGLLAAHRLSWLPPPLMDIESQFAGDVFTFHRGLVHAIILPTVAALVGGPCRTCAADTSGESQWHDCPDCKGHGHILGLAATLGRLMGAWSEEECQRCSNRETVTLIEAMVATKNCPDCHGTGLTWVPGGVLGCVTRVDISDPVPAGPQESAPLGPRGHYGWWASLDDTPSPAGVGREDLPRALWDLLTGHNPDSPATATHWKWWPTPDLARSALGEAGKWFCRMATAS